LHKSDLTLKEVCERLGKSRRTISRYISNGVLNPTKVKSSLGTLAYKFELKEIENFKISGKVARTDKTGNKTGHRTGQRGNYPFKRNDSGIKRSACY